MGRGNESARAWTLFASLAISVALAFAAPLLTWADEADVAGGDAAELNSELIAVGEDEANLWENEEAQAVLANLDQNHPEDLPTGDNGAVELAEQDAVGSDDNEPLLVPAASNSAASAALSRLKEKSGFTGGSSYGTGGCKRFVDAVCRELYGEAAPSGTSGGYYLSGSLGNWKLVNTLTWPSQSAVTSLMKQGHPGDVVQFCGGSGSGAWGSAQHTFILEAVSDSGITVYEHGDSSGVRTTTMTWSYFYSTYGNLSSRNPKHETPGISLYHHKNYEKIFGNGFVAPNPNSATDIPARWYRIRLKADPGQGIDIQSSSTEDGGNLHVWRWGGGANQSFSIDPTTVGSYQAYTISPVHTNGKYLTVQYESMDSGANVFQWSNNGSNSQKWYIERNGDGTYSIRNVRSGLYLDVYGGHTANATNVDQYAGNGSDAQKFYLIPGNPTLWTVKLSNTNNQYEYTGNAIDPKLKAYASPTCPNFEIPQGQDYSVSYSNNVNVGTASWKITSMGVGENNTATGTFKIVAAPISRASVGSVGSRAYTGSAQTPKPTLTFNGKTLREGTDYTLSYSNNTNVGTATIYIYGKGNFSGSRSVTFSITQSSTPSATNVPVYRLYNWRTSEHLYTTNKGEYDSLVWHGWVREGIAWYAPSSSGTPVYRLYNPRSGDHHYTTSSGERDALVARHGWRSEGTAFYSDDSRRVAVYRVYNGRLRRGQHHFTTSSGERGSLVSRNGWRDEGTAFYAAANGNPITPKYPNSVPAGIYKGNGLDGAELTLIIYADGTCEGRGFPEGTRWWPVSVSDWSEWGGGYFSPGGRIFDTDDGWPGGWVYYSTGKQRVETIYPSNYYYGAGSVSGDPDLAYSERFVLYRV